MAPSFGLAPLGFLDVPPPQFIRMAAEAGFASVNLRTRPATPGGPAHPVRAGGELARAILAACSDTGLSVVQIEQVGLDRNTDVASLREMMEGAASIGATRLLCSGDDPELSVVTDRFAELCHLATEIGIAVDLEFMRFRALKTVEDALSVVAASGAANGRVCVDALHLIRSGGSVAAIRSADDSLLGPLQLCDAPLAPPAPDAIAEEARENRLLPGEGALPLLDLMAAYPRDCPIDAEVPLRRAHENLDAAARAALIAEAMRRLLARRP